LGVTGIEHARDAVTLEEDVLIVRITV